MIKLKRYVKPYLGYVIGMILLMFCQAAVDLKLPNLMSDIVNVGIQHSGIEENAPKVIDRDTMQTILLFAPQEDSATLEKGYRLVHKKDMDEQAWNEFISKWPVAADEQVLELNYATSAEKAAIEKAFSRASYTAAQLMQNASADKSAPVAMSETGDLTIDQMRALLASFSPELLQNAMVVSASAPEMMLQQTAAVWIRKIYTGLGADLGAMQSHYILLVGGKMLLMTLLLVLCAVSVGFCTSRLGTGVAKDLRHDIFVHAIGFTSNEFDRYGTASLITRNTNDVMQVQGLLSMGLRVMVYAPIIGLGGIFMALQKSSGMAWIIVLAAVIIFGIIWVLFAVAVPRFKIMQKLVDKLNLVSRENLSGMMVIRAFATQKFEEERFAKANRELADNNLFVFRAMATMMPIMTLIMNGMSLLIVWVGGHHIAASTMQVGDMMAFIQYTMQIIMSFLLISMVFVMVPRAVVSANRIAQVLDTKNSVEDAQEPKHLPKQMRGVVQFTDVSFRYQGAEENVLDHVSFTACPGQTTAFIGSTGSGKSTLVNLIPRFYDVSEGSITLDGVDIREIAQSELREVIGYVPQKGILFSGDIASNLRFGDANASEAAMREAVETAQAAEFVDQLSAGLGTKISQGGTNVSGGQRQRLSIARALVKKAHIFIFDDTFSALDFKTDAKLRAALKQRTQDATVLIVAQRVSTIMHAEQIVVLDEGHVVGIGTHEELLKTCNTYQEIAQSQLSKEELA